jgi:hypothetical protein
MNNPVVHVLVFISAVLIPGGLLVYFAWRVTKKARNTKKEKGPKDQKSPPGK